MPESTQLSAIRRANLTKEIVNRIIRLIDDLKEREFISTFWAGCSSVREALKILSAIGVVRIVSGAGMFALVGKPLCLSLLRNGRCTAELIKPRRVLDTEFARGRSRTPNAGGSRRRRARSRRDAGHG